MNMTISEKFMLTISEASEYFNIGVKKLRRLSEDNLGKFAVQNGNHILIIRISLEEFLRTSSSV